MTPKNHEEREGAKAAKEKSQSTQRHGATEKNMLSGGASPRIEPNNHSNQSRLGIAHLLDVF